MNRVLGEVLAWHEAQRPCFMDNTAPARLQTPFVFNNGSYVSELVSLAVDTAMRISLARKDAGPLLRVVDIATSNANLPSLNLSMIASNVAELRAKLPSKYP